MKQDVVAMIDRVEISEEIKQFDSKDVLCYTVQAHWKNVDRPKGVGRSCFNRKDLADRLKKCMEDGAAFGNVKICTDVNGKTYVDEDFQILMRIANADLKRIGY